LVFEDEVSPLPHFPHTAAVVFSVNMRLDLLLRVPYRLLGLRRENKILCRREQGIRTVSCLSLYLKVEVINLKQDSVLFEYGCHTVDETLYNTIFRVTQY
jgi:hypothetical protein